MTYSNKVSGKELTRGNHVLISVSDKTGIVDFAKALVSLGYQILSTGGTFSLLQQHSVDATEVSEYTGFPEMMDGRLKTLHPLIHGGILCRIPQDADVISEHGISPIDLVVVNLYPFAATVASKDCTLERAIEQIDIGGPTMIRAAAKNHARCMAVVDPKDYDQVVHWLMGSSLTPVIRFQMATKAFAHTAAYDGAISNYMSALHWQDDDVVVQQEYPKVLTQQWHRSEIMRYGENPHQSAASYFESPKVAATVVGAQQLQGKPLSYNNVADTDAALSCVKIFIKPACVIVKHANPCGVAVVPELEGGLLQAYVKAYESDPESAFGGVIAFNRTLDVTTAEAIVAQQFVEVVVAPFIDVDAISVFASKSNVRLLAIGPWTDQECVGWDMKRIEGGLLVQSRDLMQLDEVSFQTAGEHHPSSVQMDDLIFAWKLVKFVKSNAIVYAKNRQSLGIGAGQSSRINAARIAADKATQAGLNLSGSVMASDAFLPFRDAVDHAASLGVNAIIQPGGSIRDSEVIDACNEHQIALIFTHKRHFKH